MKYQTFIQGETIDLVIPNEAAIKCDGWNQWVSDPIANKYSGRGRIPITIEQQLEFMKGLQSPKSNRFALLIRPKDAEKTVGIVSLSSIEYEVRTAQTAIIMSETSSKFRDSSFFALEAKARITEHAFIKLGLNKVFGSQVTEYSKWQDYQLMFGFKPEALNRDAFYADGTYYNVIVSGCLHADYSNIVAERGSYWPGKAAVFKEMRRLQNMDLVGKLELAFAKIYDDLAGFKG